VSARGLRNADCMPGQGVSDPYCVCRVVGRQADTFETAYIKDSLDPVWNHEGTVLGCEAGDKMVFSVWDKDFVKRDDLLGRAELVIGDNRMFFDGELRMLGTGEDSKSFLRVKISEAICPGRVNTRSCSEVLESESSRPTPDSSPGARRTNSVRNAWLGGGSQGGGSSPSNGPSRSASQGRTSGRCGDPGGQAQGQVTASTEAANLDEEDDEAGESSPWDSNFGVLHDGTDSGCLLPQVLSLGWYCRTLAGCPPDAARSVSSLPCLHPLSCPKASLAPLATRSSWPAHFADDHLEPERAARKRFGLLSTDEAMLRSPTALGCEASKTCIAEECMPEMEVSSGVRGSMHASLKEHGSSRKIKVMIISARGLRNADIMLGQGVSDPFCTCTLSGRPGAMVKTRTVNDSLDPVWNHEDEFSVCAQGGVLEFTVWDKDLFKQDDLLGRAELDISPTHMFFDGELKLSGGGCQVSFLRVKVSEATPTESAAAGASQAVASTPSRSRWLFAPGRKSAWPSLGRPPRVPPKLVVVTDAPQVIGVQPTEASPASSSGGSTWEVDTSVMFDDTGSPCRASPTASKLTAEARAGPPQRLC